MNNFVKTNADIDAAIEQVKAMGWPTHRWNHFKNWEMLWLEEYVKSGDVLDIGCVTSMPLEIAIHLGNKDCKVGIDPEPTYSGWSIPPGCDFVQGVAEELPFKDGTFDVVTCLSVIEHGINLDKFANEVWRVLRPNGVLVVTFDFWPYPKDHHSLDFSELIGLITHLSSLGFTIERMGGSVQDKIVDGLYTLGALRAFKPK